MTKRRSAEAIKRSAAFAIALTLGEERHLSQRPSSGSLTGSFRQLYYSRFLYG